MFVVPSDTGNVGVLSYWHLSTSIMAAKHGAHPPGGGFYRGREGRGQVEKEKKIEIEKERRERGRVM